MSLGYCVREWLTSNLVALSPELISLPPPRNVDDVAITTSDDDSSSNQEPTVVSALLFQNELARWSLQVRQGTKPLPAEPKSPFEMPTQETRNDAATFCQIQLDFQKLRLAQQLSLTKEQATDYARSILDASGKLEECARVHWLVLVRFCVEMHVVRQPLTKRDAHSVQVVQRLSLCTGSCWHRNIKSLISATTSC